MHLVVVDVVVVIEIVCSRFDCGMGAVCGILAWTLHYKLTRAFHAAQIYFLVNPARRNSVVFDMLHR